MLVGVVAVVTALGITVLVILIGNEWDKEI